MRDTFGAPIANASVWESYAGSVRVLSDSAGRFTLPVSHNHRYVWVFGSAAGYEPDAQQTADAVHDLTLHHPLRIAVGDSIRVTVHPNDPNLWLFDSSFPGGEVDYRFRVVRITSDRTMRVELRVTAEDGGLTYVFVRNACCDGLPQIMSMVPGREVEVEIRMLGWGSTPRTFTVSTVPAGGQ